LPGGTDFRKLGWIETTLQSCCLNEYSGRGYATELGRVKAGAGYGKIPVFGMLKFHFYNKKYDLKYCLTGVWLYFFIICFQRQSYFISENYIFLIEVILIKNMSIMIKLLRRIDEEPSIVEIDSPGGVKEKILNYYKYMSEVMVNDPVDGQREVFMSYLFERSILEQMLSSNPDSDGFRFYLAKDGSNLQKDISMVAVPVKAEIVNSELIRFSNQIKNGDVITHPECRSTHCRELISNQDDLLKV
jgi:hypothetical protein